MATEQWSRRNAAQSDGGLMVGQLIGLLGTVGLLGLCRRELDRYREHLRVTGRQS